MFNLKARVGIILLLVAVSIAALWPRSVFVRKRDENGRFMYTNGDSTRPVMDTVKRLNLRRGLDLQGGMHIALEIDESKGAVADKADALKNAETVIRNRIDQFGVAEPNVQLGEDRIIVELPGIDDPIRAENVVKQSAFLQMQIVDETQALEKSIGRIDQALRRKGIDATAATAADTAKGVTGLFAATDSANKAGADSAAGRDSTTDTTAALFAERTGGAMSKLVSPGSLPGEYMIPIEATQDVTSWLNMPEVQAALPPGKVLRLGADTISAGARLFRGLYVLDQRPVLTGDYLEKADAATDPIEGTLVRFELNNEGGRRFKSETGKHIRDYLATVLDDRVMNRPAVIQGAIGTRGQITMGGRDLKSAQDFALVLRAGALKVPLKPVEVRNIGPSLGDDSVKSGIRAGLVAIALVIFIMVGYYRFSGLLAVGALALYVLFTLAVLAMFDAVLTLPGLAGFVLTIGIAVDANVLVFERIREELERGKTVRTAIDEGFKHAMSAIVDTSLTTILTGAVLYQYGTGPVRGFAVTLIAGIAASLFTAIFVTRTFYLLWLNRHRGAVQTLSI